VTLVVPPDVGPSVTLPVAVSAAQESALAVAVMAPATTVSPAARVARPDL